MDVGFIFTLVVSFAILFIGVITTYHDKKSVTNMLFAYISLATVAWSLANYFSLEPVFFSKIIWVRLVIFFAIPHVVLFYLFVRNFPKTAFSLSKIEFYGLSIVGLVMMIIAMTPLIFSEFNNFGNILVPSPGILMPVFSLFIVSILMASIVQIIIKYSKADNKEKTSWRFMLIGFVISYTLLIFTNFVLVNTTGNTFFVLYAPLFMLPSIMGTAFSILRYRLLNVKAIATEIIIFVLLSITLVQIALSQTAVQFVFNSALFCAFLITGIFLIKSVLKEVEQREKIERLAADLEMANIKLKELDELKSQFLSFASHQLRAPLTAIGGYTSMLLEGDFGKITEKVKNSIQTIDGSSRSLTKIVNEFLDVSRIEQGRMKYEFIDFDVRKLTEEVVTELRPNVENKGLSFKFKSESKQNYLINGDSGKIKQVIGNLLDNSIKYTPSGGIEVNVERKANKILISIIDTGIGIRREDITKLFSMFTRAKDASKTNVMGTGLGLYVAKQMIEANHGQVWVESVGADKGSTFFIELPAKA